MVVENYSSGSAFSAGIEASGPVLITNCVAWSNRGYWGTSEPSQVRADGNAGISHSSIQGLSGGLGGQGNTGVDPSFVGGPSGTWTGGATYEIRAGVTTFVNANASWHPGHFTRKFLNPDVSQYLQCYVIGNTATTLTVLGDYSSLGRAGRTYRINDYQLRAGSPCIDAGDNSAVPPDTLDLDVDGDSTEPVPFDLDGDLRFRNDPTKPDTGLGTPPLVDMGAYEYQRGCLTSADCDNANPCDGVETCVNNACEPGTPIVCDDGDPCNGTESCDAVGSCVRTLSADCNGNTVEDSCDLGGGASADANHNGIPDECDSDADGDAIPDDIDVCPYTPSRIVDESGRPLGDINQNCSPNILDFQYFDACLSTSGPLRPIFFTECEAFDFDRDGDVDLGDVAAFWRAIQTAE